MSYFKNTSRIIPVIRHKGLSAKYARYPVLADKIPNFEAGFKIIIFLIEFPIQLNNFFQLLNESEFCTDRKLASYFIGLKSNTTFKCVKFSIKSLENSWLL